MSAARPPINHAARLIPPPLGTRAATLRGSGAPGSVPCPTTYDVFCTLSASPITGSPVRGEPARASSKLLLPSLDFCIRAPSPVYWTGRAANGPFTSQGDALAGGAARQPPDPASSDSGLASTVARR